MTRLTKKPQEPLSKELTDLLEMAKTKFMSPTEKLEQARSWVRGELRMLYPAN